jgi:hypothetical protein
MVSILFDDEKTYNSYILKIRENKHQQFFFTLVAPCVNILFV